MTFRLSRPSVYPDHFFLSWGILLLLFCLFFFGSSDNFCINEAFVMQTAELLYQRLAFCLDLQVICG